MPGPNRYTRAQEDWLLRALESEEFTSKKGIITKALYRAFMGEFAMLDVSMSQFVKWGERVGGGQRVPDSPLDDISEKILHITSAVTLITSDYQVPYHDAEAVRFAFQLASLWGVTEHVINGDLYDFANLSKFDPSLHGHRLDAGEDLQIGGAIILESRRLFAHTTFVPGNHEWRLFLRRLSAQLQDDQIKELLAPGEDVSYTPLSYLVLNESVRVTHPGSASIIPSAVARALAERHHMNVIVAHGHGLGYARSYGGHYWCIESGGLFDPNRMDYAMTTDRRRPASNQGFVIMDGDTPYLIDLASADRDAWLFFAEARAKLRA